MLFRSSTIIYTKLVLIFLTGRIFWTFPVLSYACSLYRMLQSLIPLHVLLGIVKRVTRMCDNRAEPCGTVIDGSCRRNGIPQHFKFNLFRVGHHPSAISALASQRTPSPFTICRMLQYQIDYIRLMGMSGVAVLWRNPAAYTAFPDRNVTRAPSS